MLRDFSILSAAFFMTENIEQTVSAESAAETPLCSFVKIIDKLAGDKSNLKIRFQELKFNLGNAKVTLNGEVNFDVTHSPKTPT